MGQDIVKAVTLNGRLVQTGRDVLPWADVVKLAGFGPGARVAVTVREQGSTLTSAERLERGRYVAVRPGLVLTVTVAPRD